MTTRSKLTQPAGRLLKAPEGFVPGDLVNDISKALKKAGYPVEPSNIKTEGAIKSLGMYTLEVELDPEVTTEVKVWIVPTASVK